MRIIAGRHRGRRIAVPGDAPLRPTADRTRESLFNILTKGRLLPDQGDLVAGARVLDAFAGSGALGLEALSRGAACVTFMEMLAVAYSCCQTNVATLGEEEKSQVLRADVLRPPSPPADGPFAPCDLVLMDPPYNQGLAPPALAALAAAGWLRSGTIICVEVMAKEPFEPPASFEPLEERKYGKARLCFLQAKLG